MNVEEILDMLEEQLDQSWNLPLSGGKCVVDAERVHQIVDDIRLNLPTEIKQAKAIVSDRADIMASARKEAESIVRKAEDRARALVAQEEILKQAQVKATELLTQAQTKSREMRAASQEFSDMVLRQTEEAMARALADVKTTRSAIRSARQHQQTGTMPAIKMQPPENGPTQQ